MVGAFEKPPPSTCGGGLPISTRQRCVAHNRMDYKGLKTGADRSVDVQNSERVEVQRLVGVLNSLVRGMTGAQLT